MLADDIAEVLTARPGLTATQLAAELELSTQPGRAASAPAAGQRDRQRREQAVWIALFANHGRFRCDQGQPPRWWLAEPSPDGGRRFAAGGDGRPTHPPSATTAGQPRLYRWQADALAAWVEHGRRGVIEAVTGTGKTMVGIAAAIEEVGQRGQVLVLVPTVELQQQWLVELAARLPAATPIGRFGAGAADSLTSHDVLVAIVNSARGRDVRPIRRGGLLVADECHRYGSAVNRMALDHRFTHRLGLSATYARDDDGNLAWLDPYFGGTCFQMGYRRALADEVTAHFVVALVGVQFSPEERRRYEQLTDVMRQQRARLVQHYGVPPDPIEAFMAAVNALADGDGPASGVARAYRGAMVERRRLMADTPAKDAAAALLAPAIRSAQRAIVFTQSIAAGERVCLVLGRLGIRAGVVHSKMAGSARRQAMRRFENGELRVIAAPRVLDEGVDVPAADLAVIAGASHSRRQMVQRMGRVLRRKADGRNARFAVVYVEATVEDPHLGAHEAFLDEVTDEAEEVRWFPADMALTHPKVLCDFLIESSRGVAQPLPHMSDP